MEYYLKFSWKNGTPFGIDPTNEPHPIAYKIVKDPYRKRFSVERYHDFVFHTTVYDSGLFDFRKLRTPEQKVWQKQERGNECLIRDEDDRLILKERYFFDGEICREVELRSPQDILVARQKMFYTHLEDSFDGAVLFDLEGGVVLWKKYALESDTGLWSHVTSQGWGSILTQESCETCHTGS